MSTCCHQWFPPQMWRQLWWNRFFSIIFKLSCMEVFRFRFAVELEGKGMKEEEKETEQESRPQLFMKCLSDVSLLHWNAIISSDIVQQKQQAGVPSSHSS